MELCLLSRVDRRLNKGSDDWDLTLINVRDGGSKSGYMVSLRSSIQQLNTQLQCPIPVHWPPASQRILLTLLFPHWHLESWWRLMHHITKAALILLLLSPFCPCWNGLDKSWLLPNISCYPSWLFSCHPSLIRSLMKHMTVWKHSECPESLCSGCGPENLIRRKWDAPLHKHK